MGFTFDDTDTNGVASPIAEMHRLIAKDPRNAERIFPYIGGKEVNDSPTHAHHRYVINFGMMDEMEARRWPDLISIVEQRVKPERLEQDREIRRRNWWRFGEPTPALFHSIQGMESVMVIARVSQHHHPTFLCTGTVFSEQLVVLASQSRHLFTCVQSRPHELWFRFFGSTQEDRPRYTPSDCFETFPFPKAFDMNPALEAMGKEYYDFRAALMVRNNEGLTKTYNRFHDPAETSADILKLRELHAAMDRAVLDAYGWTDIRPTCEFLLDYEEEEEEESETGGLTSPARRQKKKPWRFRWPDDVRDEVLARLLALNQERAEQERVTGAAAEAAAKKSAKRGRRKRKGGDEEQPLLGK